MAIDIESFKKKFESTLKRADETITPVRQELKREFSKLEVSPPEKKGSYQEQVVKKEQQQPSPNAHFRTK